MLWSIGDGFSITNSSLPGGAVAVLAVNASAPVSSASIWRTPFLAVGLAALLHAHLGERARVLARDPGHLADVGGDVARVVARHQVRAA